MKKESNLALWDYLRIINDVIIFCYLCYDVKSLKSLKS